MRNGTASSNGSFGLTRKLLALASMQAWGLPQAISIVGGSPATIVRSRQLSSRFVTTSSSTSTPPPSPSPPSRSRGPTPYAEVLGEADAEVEGARAQVDGGQRPVLGGDAREEAGAGAGEAAAGAAAARPLARRRPGALPPLARPLVLAKRRRTRLSPGRHNIDLGRDGGALTSGRGWGPRK